MVPVHPVTEPERLLRLHACEAQHPGLTSLDKLGDAVSFDVPLAFESEFLLDLDLHPQALTVEAVLVALPVPEHRVIPAEQILVRPAPRVVHAHRVVCGDRTVEKRPALRGLVIARQVPRERAFGGPPLHERALLRRKICARVDRSKCHRAAPPITTHRAMTKPRPSRDGVTVVPPSFRVRASREAVPR